MPCQSRANMCPLPVRSLSGDLWWLVTYGGLRIPRWAPLWWTLVIPPAELELRLCAMVAHSYKIGDEGVDRHGVDEGPMRVAFERGYPFLQNRRRCWRLWYRWRSNARGGASWGFPCGLLSASPTYSSLDSVTPIDRFRVRGEGSQVHVIDVMEQERKSFQKASCCRLHVIPYVLFDCIAFVCVASHCLVQHMRVYMFMTSRDCAYLWMIPQSLRKVATPILL
jgi:hypothetical protein